jgi:hypothetical protein
MLGSIMTDSRNKKDKLSATTMSYLQELHKEELFGYRRDITNLAITKGIMKEDESIRILSNIHDRPYESQYTKNEEGFQNDFITGTPDIHVEGEFVGDVKSSFNLGTYPLYKEFTDLKKQNKNYYWQMQGYMWLTSINKGILAYCLVDTPLEVVEGVKFKRMRELDCQDLSIITPEGKLIDHGSEEQSEEDRIVKEHSPSTWMREEHRVVQFPVGLNEDDIEKLKERVSECREYMNELSDYLTNKVKLK